VMSARVKGRAANIPKEPQLMGCSLDGVLEARYLTESES
jgi:hypothetical protein